METSSALSLKSCPWIGFERIGKKPNGSMRFSTEERSLQKLNLRDLKSRSGVSIQSRPVASKISCSYEKAAGGETNLPVSDVSGCREYIGKSPVQFVGNPYDLQVVVRESLRTCSIFHLTAPAVESESSCTSVDEALILKKKAKDVLPYLNGRCIYLVGMMGSGKTTVGKILSEALGYSFFDSDKLVEQAVGGTTVSQIFKQYSEAFFRDNESEVLRDLSSMHRLVVATGGGAVIRPINWRYMKQGITVWLDVPLEALARRIAAVGTDSRPLLHQESGDAYTKAFARLTTLFGERGEAYANADSTVSLQYIATKQGHVDVGVITPTAIAIEALIQIENCLNAESNGMCL